MVVGCYMVIVYCMVVVEYCGNFIWFDVEIVDFYLVIVVFEEF